ncbi:hypothetical protein [Ruegeria sp. HKCCA4633]|uniref:hypothetical protein n=1 Tax=Ruegeria sp. HKCCA4633 TaxID=2682983 RepID=UPI00148866C9|nr:hypothetical protein [Ruegeria sp. HKCCA4633]
MNTKRFLSLTDDQKFETLNSLPQKLKDVKCWAVAKIYPDPKPGEEQHPDHKRPFHPLTNEPVSVTDPSTWATFDECLSQVVDGWKYNVLGPILHEGLDATVLDLDNKKNDPKIAAAHKELVDKYWDKTYVEFSQSGTDHHIFYEGRLVQGGRKEPDLGTEIYDTERFIIMTGVSNGLDLAPDTDGTITQMVASMPEQTKLVDLPTVEDIRTVEAIIEKMMAAGGNTEGQQAWKHGYPANCDPSHVDSQIAELILYHTSDIQKARVIFERGTHWTPDRIAKKETGRRGQSYVDRTLSFAWSNVHQRQQEQAERIKQVTEAVQQIVEREQNQPVEQHPTEIDIPVKYGALHAAYRTCAWNGHTNFPIGAVLSALTHVGAIVAAKFVAPTKSGLNLYTALVAPSGWGKEAAPSEGQALIRSAAKTIQNDTRYTLEDYIGRSAGSKVKLHEQIAANDVQVRWKQELGKVIRNVIKVGGHGGEIMDFETRLYTLSAVGKVLEGHEVRDQKIDDIKDKERPIYAFVGEMTPTDLNGIDPRTFNDGSMSRYLWGMAKVRPTYNDEENPDYDNSLDIQAVAGLFEYTMTVQSDYYRVPWGPDAREWYLNRRRLCNKKSDEWWNAGNEIGASCMNRYVENLIRVATIAAVCRHQHDPQNQELAVLVEDLRWASTVVDYSVESVKELTGSIGQMNDAERVKRVITMLRIWIKTDGSSPRVRRPVFKTYADDNMRFYFPFGYISTDGGTKHFPDKRDVTRVLNDMIASGLIVEVNPERNLKWRQFYFDPVILE